MVVLQRSRPLAKGADFRLGALGGQGAIYPNRQQSREERKKAAGDKDQTS